MDIIQDRYLKKNRFYGAFIACVKTEKTIMKNTLLGVNIMLEFPISKCTVTTIHPSIILGYVKTLKTISCFVEQRKLKTPEVKNLYCARFFVLGLTVLIEFVCPYLSSY